MSRKAQNNVTLLGGRCLHRSSHEPRLPTWYSRLTTGSSPLCSAKCPSANHGSLFRCRNSELSVDDLRTWQGAVFGRAVSTLRSVDTQPSAWGFVLSIRRDPVKLPSQNILDSVYIMSCA